MAIDRTKYNDEETTHHRGARHRKDRPKPKMQLNLTSMIDVVFQLLIYFVVTATFVVDEGLLAARLPAGGPSEADPNPLVQPLEIRLTEVGTYGVRIDVSGFPSPGSFVGLQELLRSQQRNNNNPSGIIKPDDPVKIIPTNQVRWQHVVNAFNAARAADYTNVRFSQQTGG